jgi:hypothetical protein
MDADEPRVRRRGYFLSESGSESDLPESESPEGISNFRPIRPRRIRKVISAATRRRHRAHIASQHGAGKKGNGVAVKSATSTGTHRP